MFNLFRRLRPIKFVSIISNDGESVITVPKKELYDPLYELMEDEQIPEFLKKLQDYAKSIGLEESIKKRVVVRIIEKLNNSDPNYDFLKDLNNNTDCFGRVDWEKFLA